MMYKILVLVLVIMAVVMVAIKETRQEDSTDVVYLFNKTRHDLALQQKISEDQISLNTNFERDLGMGDVAQDTLGIKLRKDLDIDLNLEEFHQKKTVGEAVDYLRLKVIARRDGAGKPKVVNDSNAEAARLYLESQKNSAVNPEHGKVAPPKDIPQEIQGAR